MIHGYETKFRQDVDLPVVDARQVFAVEQTAWLLQATVDCKIPGFGIIDWPYEFESEAVLNMQHEDHKDLVIDALHYGGVDIGYPNDYFTQDLAGLNMFDGREPHMDIAHNRKDLAVGLRLHTNELQGAKVLMSNGKTFAPAGDEELFFGRGIDDEVRKARGYESTEASDPANDIARIEFGDTVPELSDPHVYHFDQPLGCSVVFRFVASIGGPTVHGFRTYNPTKPRPIFTSDVMIYSKRGYGLSEEEISLMKDAG